MKAIILFLALFISAAFAAGMIAKTTYKPKVCKDGLMAAYGDAVAINYFAKIKSTGEVFESSYDMDEPLLFIIGDGEMLDAFEEGILGMCENEKRTIFIPPELAYGDEQVGQVPPGSTLIFEVEMLAIERESMSDYLKRKFPDFIKVGLPLMMGCAILFLLLQKYGAPPAAKPSNQKPRNPYSKTQIKRERNMKMPLVPLGD